MADRFKNLKNYWLRFVNSHDAQIEIPAMIAQSWERCWPHISARSKITLQKLSNDDLLRAQVLYFDFLSIARPIIEDIYQYLEGSSSAILIVNATGYVLDMIGEARIVSHLNQLNILRGSLLSEMEMGTNAFALAITERVPVQVQGYQHYCSQFHSISEAAAPIFDITGKPLGALGIINFETDTTPHSLALAVSGARAIEGQRQADQLLGEQNNQLARLNAILNTISEAILVWDREGNLIQANPAAAEMLNLNLDPAKGRQTHENIQIPQLIKSAVELGKELTDVEASLIIGGQHLDCILSLRVVRGTEGIQAIVTILRRVKEIRQVLQRQIGTQATYTLQDLIGKSSEIQRVHRQVTIAAAARASVMIRGEPGSGKNLLAQIIHRHSTFSEGPFITFSCSSVPVDLVVRELLGYEGGTNPLGGNSRPGKIELADGGTLFFQDVDALPLEAQAILLNVLELGIVQRMFSSRPIVVDVRIIASSAANLERLIEEGNFRPDLYYRLSSFEIRLPPLRERIEDVPLLVENILRRLSLQYHENLSISPGAIDLLSTYHWPGNLRELEAVIGRAASQVAGGEAIAPTHLPDFIQRPYRLKLDTAQLLSGNSLSEIEYQALLQSAYACKGNVTKMMDVLGVSRTTLWRKLKQYDINIQEYRHRASASRHRSVNVSN
jgi:transcriptional regulator of acetoin/glycerol metabolism